jgi:hypothetical protein
MPEPSANAVYVQALGSALRSIEDGFGAVPGLLREVLSSGAWREFTTPRGETAQYEQFADFLATPPSMGLGVSVALVRRVVADDAEVLDRLDQALANSVGVPTDDRGEAKPTKGADRADAALRRLQKDAPAMHAEVLAGRLSANKAMIEAGLRPRTTTVRLDDVTKAAGALRRSMKPDQIRELIVALQSEAE